MENQEKKSHGGKREGAGRKRTVAKRYMFNAPDDLVPALEAAPNKSEFIAEAIRFYIAHGGLS